MLALWTSRCRKGSASMSSLPAAGSVCADTSNSQKSRTRSALNCNLLMFFYCLNVAFVTPVILVKLPGFFACYRKLVFVHARLFQKHLGACVADKLHHNDTHFRI